MALTTAQLDQQKKQAEELLFSGPETLGFVKALFFGHFRGDLVFPYSALSTEQAHRIGEVAAKVRRFAEDHIDAAAIDRNADIPRSVIDGLADLGVLGMTAPQKFGGLGFSQQSYTRIVEIIGGHCASTGVFVNAHHSIGIRALLLFGSPEQQAEWLPDLISGKKLAAFALTEPQAGSDASNVQTTATPDGDDWILNGEKRYITNAAIAQVLTVMARTPVPDKPGETRITAFLVSPEMPGFEMIEPRMEKCGIRGTATGRFRFNNVRVPKKNVLGQVGKGLKIALTVLDFGRTTFGASCTGVAKVCLQAAVKHAKNRVQFQQPLAEFELVRKKIAFMSAHAFAMESMTNHCAATIDSGGDDYMLETAILKVFATEHLWTIVNDTIQIHGGQAYFCNEPYERMMRDARINTIGEGANDVLKAFIAVVGTRGPGLKLDHLRKGVKSNIFRTTPSLLRFSAAQIWNRLSLPRIPAQHPTLREPARQLAKRVKKLGVHLPWMLLKCGTEAVFLQSQYLHERLADLAIDLYASACVLSRLDYLLMHRPDSLVAEEYEASLDAGKYFLKLAILRMDQNFRSLYRNVDSLTDTAAKSALARW